MKIGLVLEGGAMRGIYTAGVLDALLENNIHIDGIMGVSAGAIHGCSFVSNQKGRSIRYYEKYCRDKRFMSFYSLITTGSIVGEKFCYHDIPETLDPFDNDAFESSDIDFYVVCSNLESGCAEYIKCESLRGENIKYMLASASMPFVSKTVKKDGKLLLDGGVCDSIPVKEFERMGYDKIITVLTRPDGYRKTKGGKLAAKLMYRKYPKFTDAICNRHENYNNTLDYISQKEKDGKLFVIRPSKDLNISRTEKDISKIKAQYQLGHSDAENSLSALMSFVKEL